MSEDDKNRKHLNLPGMVWTDLKFICTVVISG